MSVSAIHAADTDRVRARTMEAVNSGLDRAARDRISDAAADRRFEERLHQLNREWDFERIVEAEAAATGLLGLVLAATVHRGFLIMPGFAAGMMLVHALNGWYPLLPLFRRLGVRSQDEIDRERYALKALRGDFREIRTAESDHKAEAAWNAVTL